jgi:hypothetical protein
MSFSAETPYLTVILYSRINAGAFRVPWEDTVAVLDELGLNMTVYEIIPVNK